MKDMIKRSRTTRNMKYFMFVILERLIFLEIDIKLRVVLKEMLCFKFKPTFSAKIEHLHPIFCRARNQLFYGFHFRSLKIKLDY